MEAIYALFDRKKILPLLRGYGRFSRKDLEVLIWSDYTPVGPFGQKLWCYLLPFIIGKFSQLKADAAAFIMPRKIFCSAREWYQKAADAGNTDAKQALSELPSTLPKPHLEFSYEYSFPDPNGSGPRKWLKITDDDWIERFPNGVENKLRRQGSEVVDGDLGTVFVLLRDPDLLYFVPDKGSAKLWIRDRRVSAGNGKWFLLGKMVFPAD